MAKFFLFSIFLGLAAFTILEAEGRIIELNSKSDASSDFWLKNDCTYSESYEVFYEKCNYTIADPELLKTHNGFWSPCKKTACELIYFGGRLPAPKNIRVVGIVDKAGSILVEGRESPMGAVYEHEVMNIVHVGETLNWDDITAGAVDGHFEDSYAFRFQLKAPTAQDFAMIDSILIDLGEEVPEPEVPTTTAKPDKPDPPKTEFVLDVKSDSSSGWKEISCNYADIAEDLWVWGCPEGIKSQGEALGYWAPCSVPRCDFVFYAGDAMPRPSVINIKGILAEGGVVSISHKKLGSTTYEDVTTVTIQASATEWTYNLPAHFDNDLYNISISSGDASPIVVDSISVNLKGDDGQGDGGEGGGTVTTTESKGNLAQNFSFYMLTGMLVTIFAVTTKP